MCIDMNITHVNKCIYISIVLYVYTWICTCPCDTYSHVVISKKQLHLHLQKQGLVAQNPSTLCRCFPAPLRWLHIVPSAATCWIVWLCPFERFAGRGVLGLESHNMGLPEIAGLSPPYVIFLMVHRRKINGSLKREHEANLVSPSMVSAKTIRQFFHGGGNFPNR